MSTLNNIAIVVVGYNRKDSLKRLLTSLQNAVYKNQDNIDLVISLDYSGSKDCFELAGAFEWSWGVKKIIQQKNRLGLKAHIISCGNLTDEYGAIILLEDDLYVSKYFYQYAVQVVSFYNNDPKIAGIALYNYRFNEFAKCPFEPISDQYDNYFLKVPCSWGQIWTNSQWKSFLHFFNDRTNDEGIFIPDIVKLWPLESSWKRVFFEYMIAENKYFVYPRISLSTNFGDAGQHYNNIVSIWQTPMLMQDKEFFLSKLEDSISVYDAFFELDEVAINKIKKTNISISFDLNGIKPIDQIKSDYILSAKKCHSPLGVYSNSLYPYECNYIYNIKTEKIDDSCFFFGKTKDFSDEKNFERLKWDIKRIFLDESFFINLGKKEMMNSKRYQIGNRLLSPILLIRKALKRFIRIKKIGKI
jgi:hypothetical protein